MTSNLRVLLLQCPEVFKELKSEVAEFIQAESLREMVGLLLENDVDVIILHERNFDQKKLAQIYDKFKVPFLDISDGSGFSKKQSLALIRRKEGHSLRQCLEENFIKVEANRTDRENKKLAYVLSKITSFAEQVTHSTEELFIAGVQSYFRKNFNIQSCSWVEVKRDAAKSPPILQLLRQLKAQTVDQGALIADLESYGMEVLKKENFQIWRNSNGQLMILLWIHEENEISQCLVINKLQLDRRVDIESLLSHLSPFLSGRWTLCQEVEEHRKQVYRDGLTGLFNQRFLTEVINKKIEENRRYKTPFSVLFLDVDHFKRVNDSLGHIVGSGVLTQLGKLLKAEVRDSDYAFRYGGDEFILLLSHTDGDDAVDVAERIREKVESFKFYVSDIQVKITVSIGLAFYPEHASSAEQVIRIADEAMYYGKHKSRNIVYKAG